MKERHQTRCSCFRLSMFLTSFTPSEQTSLCSATKYREIKERYFPSLSVLDSRTLVSFQIRNRDVIWSGILPSGFPELASLLFPPRCSGTTAEFRSPLMVRSLDSASVPLLMPR